MLSRSRLQLTLRVYRYTKTTILKPQVVERLVSKGVEFAEVGDCTTAVLRIACDKTVNGTLFSLVVLT